MKKKIRDLEDLLDEKNIIIEEYVSILEKVDGNYEKKNKSKFSKEAQNLLSEVKNKANSFNNLFEELKKTEGYYARIKK